MVEDAEERRVEMKKKILFLLICALSFFNVGVSCQESYLRTIESLEKFELREITNEVYNYGDNWDEICASGYKIFIAYIIEGTGDSGISKIVTEVMYLASKNGSYYFLGGFSKGRGFIDADGNEFLVDKGLRIGGKFYNNLLGLSLDVIERPFSLIGIARLADTGRLYQTERLARIYLSTTKKLTIAQYISMY